MTTGAGKHRLTNTDTWLMLTNKGPRDECWLVNRLLVNKVSELLKYECHKNGFIFIVEDDGWAFTNGSDDGLHFCKDSIHFVEQGNIKLAESILPTLTSRNNQINFSPKNCSTLYSDVFKQFVPATISLFFKWTVFLHCPVFVNLSLNL